MFPRVVTHNRKNKTYSYLVISQSIRKNGKSTTQNIANLGNIKRFTNRDVETIIDGLIRIFKLEKYALSQDVEILESLEYGNIIFWQKLWNKFNLSKIIREQLAQNGSKSEIPVEKYVEMMVVNRCINPSSKLGITRWLETTCYKELQSYTDVQPEVNYFYRSMDALLAMKDELEYALYRHLQNLFSVNVKLTFYDITSTYVYGDNCPIAEYGYSRDHRSDCQQIVIGVVTSYEGYPIKHYVFTGNTTDSTTVEQVIADLKSDYNIEETVFVGDRGMITKLNLQELENKGFSSIMGVKFRQDQIAQMMFEKEIFDWDTAENYDDNLKIIEKRTTVKEFLIWKSQKILSDINISISPSAFQALSEKISSLTDDYMPDYRDVKAILQGLSPDIDTEIYRKIFSVIKNYKGRYEQKIRFIFCLNPEIKGMSAQRRRDRIKEICGQLDTVFSKKNEKKDIRKSLNKIFKGYRRRYRRFFDLHKDKYSKSFISYSLNKNRLEKENRLDGIFVLLAQGDLEKLSPKKVVESYKNLKEVEMLHDDLKNFVDVRPIHHWLEKRVRAHVLVCVLALLLKRTVEINYLKSKSVTEPLEAISKVKLVKYKVKFSEKEDRHQVIPKVTLVNPIQKKYFKMIGIQNPMSLEKLAWCETKN